MNWSTRFLIVVAVIWTVPTLTRAQNGCITDQNGKAICGQPDSLCAANQRGEIRCTKPGGGMQTDQYGEQLCGPGFCVRDQHGNILCSSQSRGGAIVDQSGKAFCTGGCVPGTLDTCITPTK